MAFFNNKRKDFSIQPPRQQVDGTPFFVTDSANIDFTLANLNLTANLTQLLPTNGTYGDATHIPVLQIDQWGRITGVTTIPIGGGGGTYTVDNGLSPDPFDANNFQLGGALTKVTNITTSGAGRLIITGDNEPLFVKTTGAAQNAINCQSVDGDAGFFYSQNAVALVCQTDNGSYSGSYRSNNNLVNNAIAPILDILAFGNFVNTEDGFGASIDFRLMTDSTIYQISNRLISKWTRADDATRVSQFEITSVKAGTESTIFTLKGNGQLQLNNYTLSTFDGVVVKVLGVDANGNVFTTTGSGEPTAWGSITGTLTSQTDLITYLSTNYQPIGSYQPQLNGTGFVKASGTTISYDNSTYYLASNPSNFITSSALTPYLLSATAASTYEPIITVGTVSQYWRGDKTWQTFPTLGTWSTLNYPIWASGTPFVKMTAAGAFSLDTATYLTSAVTSVAALTLGTTGTDLTSTVANGTTTPVITLNVPTASATNRGALNSADWTTFNSKQNALTLTTTGTNGAATFVSNTLNIPNYNTSATSSAFYGDGFDDIVNLDGTNTYTAFISKVGSAYTLLRNIFPSSFTIAVGVTLNTNGYQITCNGTSTINGTIGSTGNAGGNAVFVNGNYSTAGAGGVSLKPLTTFTDQLLVPFTLTAGNGNNGSIGWGNPGVSIACTWYFYGSLGGGGGAGRNSVGTLVPGSTVTITTGKFLPYSGFNLPLNNYIGFGSTALTNSFISVPGGGGGAGSQLGGGWGGAGGGGGGCPFGVKLISNTITISATGLINSNGGNGGNGCGGSGANWIAGAGGGGGGGGIVYLVTNGLTYTPNNQIKAKGGTGGAGGGPGAGIGAIYTPNPGSNGTDGYIHIYNTFTGTSVFYTGQY